MSIFEDILKEAEARQAERQTVTDAANQRKRAELDEMVDHVEGRKGKRKRINWEDHRRYLHESYHAGIDQHEMARHMSVVSGKEIDNQAVSKALSVLGISTGQGTRNGMSPSKADEPDMWELVG